MASELELELERDVAAHYGRRDLLQTILAGLERAGEDPSQPTLEALAPVDEFHTAGRRTTLTALELMPLTAGIHVLGRSHRRSSEARRHAWLRHRVVGSVMGAPPRRGTTPVEQETLH
ncbi:MAG: hypothetical protein B7733_01655 [Myxococcales bacterium FL481]|nr:MAG: hypothetical protein B7733_01655 [Myxococcales bacterium FL481]